MYITIFSNLDRKEYFFSKSHCQGNARFIPITYCTPMRVTPRPSLPSGMIHTAEDVVNIFHYDEKEIPNPNPEYQPKAENLDD